MPIAIPALFDATLEDPTADRVRRSHASAISSIEASLRDLEKRLPVKRWAHLYMSADQTAAVNADLVLFDTVLAQTGGFSGPANGAIPLPPGFYRLTAGLAATPSTAIAVQSRWYLDPLDADTVIDPGMLGMGTVAGNSETAGPAGAAISYINVTEQVFVGVRVLISAGTVDVLSSWSKVLIEEVSPRLVT